MTSASRILDVEVGSTALAFLVILAIHVIAGLTAVPPGQSSRARGFPAGLAAPGAASPARRHSTAKPSSVPGHWR